MGLLIRSKNITTARRAVARVITWTKTIQCRVSQQEVLHQGVSIGQTTYMSSPLMKIGLITNSGIGIHKNSSLDIPCAAKKAKET
eukprot:15333320-Ditylum_brightwellii.AAC.2